MSTKKLDSIINSLTNTSGSFEEYAKRVQKIIDELENCKKLTKQNEALTIETKDCASKISTLEKDKVELNDNIKKIVEKNTKTLNTIELTNKSEYEILKGNYDALKNEISKLKTTIKELNLEDTEEMEYIRTNLEKIQEEPDINKRKLVIDKILKHIPESKKGGNPRKTRKQKKHKNKRSTYTLNKLVKKLCQTRL